MAKGDKGGHRRHPERERESAEPLPPKSTLAMGGHMRIPLLRWTSRSHRTDRRGRTRKSRRLQEEAGGVEVLLLASAPPSSRSPLRREEGLNHAMLSHRDENLHRGPCSFVGEGAVELVPLAARRHGRPACAAQWHEGRKEKRGDGHEEPLREQGEGQRGPETAGGGWAR